MSLSSLTTLPGERFEPFVRAAPVTCWIGPILVCSCTVTEPNPPTTPFEQIYELDPSEGVFAYSRISPDGSFLAYASEARSMPSSRAQLINVVDLRDGRILFSEPGIDAYWSPDGERMIFLSFQDDRSRVSVRHHATGAIARDIAPDSLGDYFSWANTGTSDLILTIRNLFYLLEGDRAATPAAQVPECDGIGTGQRPLISKDGRRITTFVRGSVVVRNLTDCTDIFDTGLPGAKADFSWDGRYIAFHAPKSNGEVFEIQVVDCMERTVRTITNLPGSSYFPSWTRDGRLHFRYDGPGYRGFMLASNVLDAPARPLPSTQGIQAAHTWPDVFPDAELPLEDVVLVLVWGPWSAHAPQGLTELQRAHSDFIARKAGVRVLIATDPSSREEDITGLLQRHRIQLPRITLAPERLIVSQAHNQNPTTLLFRDGVLIDRRLGAQSFEELRDWVAAARTLN
jgi:WD40 repeat protein